MVRTSVTHSAIASYATFLFLPHFDVICDLLLNKRTEPWNLFVKMQTVLKQSARVFDLGYFLKACNKVISFSEISTANFTAKCMIDIY